MLYIIVGAIVIFVVFGAIIGFAASMSERENPLKGAAAGAGAGLLLGLHQGCGCALILLGGAIAFAVGKWVLG